VTYSPDEIRALATVLQDRNLIVISDEIYDQLVFGDHEPLSYAAVSERCYAQTVTINAGSKTYSMTGWRIGYAAGPAELIQGMIKLQSQSTSGAATFTQVALAEALTGDQRVVEEMRQAFARRADHMWKRLSAMPGVACPKPTGAFYCFPNVRAACLRLGLAGSTEFAERLLEDAKVAVVPGIAFGLDNHVRLSFASDLPTIDKGLDRIEKFLLSEPRR
jgi:aspartate aminotransferase